MNTNQTNTVVPTDFVVIVAVVIGWEGNITCVVAINSCLTRVLQLGLQQQKEVWKWTDQ